MVQQWNYTPEFFVDREPELKGFGRLLQPGTPQAVMVVVGTPYMGKSWLLDRMGDECSKGAAGPAGGEAAPIPVVKIDFRAVLGQHDIQDTLSLLRLIRDGLDQPGYFWPFNSVVNWFTTGGSPALSRALADLTQALASLDFARLRLLTDYLNVRYDDLEGGEVGTLSQKSHGLVMVLQRQCRLPDLLAKLKESYPDRDWSKEEQAVHAALAAAPEPIAGPGGVAEPEANSGGGAPVDDLGATLPVDDGQTKAEASINEAFFQCLEALQGTVKPVVLLLDSIESAPPEAARWIDTELFPRLRSGKLPDVAAIVAVREAATLGDLAPGDWVVQRDLPGFGVDDIRKLFEARHVPVDDALLPGIADLSGGKPGQVDLMADNLLAKRQATEDPFFK